ncbi:aspartate kinase [Clostridium estertheticum]|uniref:Aspartokinase n=1 Tax=Clostridium estertheticum TaxID=238834 RepID=A0A7Y3SW57_9CLOT|nr:aspartate kinase [Clostridium estertheticum]MBW9170892.1 aspartate kinase [Clostridium estertheticum]NNU76247.1 aspartate kinase [Clostridium estertheticum]WBL46181.1 aspartate kinase [Clostridium estertheticum]WLC74272.1 aspartate kinase [Clostridium estertheticum]
MKILVQKFGGTSVSTKEKRKLVASKVINAKAKGYFPVVVVSAMGRKGEPYATDTLLSQIDDDFKGANPLATDLLMSCGEIISTVIMCNELNNNKVDTLPLTGGQAGIITDSSYTNAAILNVDTKRILSILKSGKVPVVAGFQGMDDKGYVTTIGRGGSDVTAALLGAALKAVEVRIYTDVDGIMTADPRIVSEATLIKKISYDEIFQFADQGAKVIHPRAVEICKKNNIPLVIKNTMNECDGTVISNFESEDDNNIITGITHMNNRVQIKATKNSGSSYDDLFDILAENFISIDLINVFPKEKIFTIDEKDFTKFTDLTKELNISYSFVKDCSKLAIIGSKMRGIPGVMARILKALTKQKIEVLQTADSHMTIWCLVETKDAQEAIIALHREFKLG